MVCPHCRDEYLQKVSEGVSVFGDAEAIEVRNEHIKHEASVKSIGLLYYLGGAGAILGSLSMLMLVAGEGASSMEGAASLWPSLRSIF